MRSPVMGSPFWFLKAFPSAVMMLAGLEDGCPGVVAADAVGGVGVPDSCWSLGTIDIRLRIGTLVELKFTLKHV